MKKKTLIMGLICILVGLLFLFFCVALDTRLNDIFGGFAGAGIGSGIVLICFYFYWTNPKNLESYAEKVENKVIESHDERKEMLRNKASRIVFILDLMIVAIAAITFSVLGKLEIINYSQPLITILTIYWVLQFVLFVVCFKLLEKAY